MLSQGGNIRIRAGILPNKANSFSDVRKHNKVCFISVSIFEALSQILKLSIKLGVHKIFKIYKECICKTSRYH